MALKKLGVHLKRLFCRSLACAALFAIPLTTLAVQEAGPSKAALDAGDSYLHALQAAAQAFMSKDYSKALDKLDMADQIQPNIPDTWRMRGAIYAQERAYEKAEDAFEKESKLNPGDFWGPYNLAELLLLQKKYAEAAVAFQRLQIYRGHEELVQFKVVLAKCLDGKPQEAKPMLDSMKFPGDTPAYYFAHAAWAFATKDVKEGYYWCESGVRIFGQDQCLSYYDAMVGPKWMPMRNPDGTYPATSQSLALPSATPGDGLQ